MKYCQSSVMILGEYALLAFNPDVTIYLDESLKRFQTVFPACGNSNSAIELTIDELSSYIKAEWIDVCKTI